MDSLKDAVWLTAHAFSTIVGFALDKATTSIESFAARKCREYLASLADEA